MKDKPESVKTRMQLRAEKNRDLGLVPISEWVPEEHKEAIKTYIADLRRKEGKMLPKDLKI